MTSAIRAGRISCSVRGVFTTIVFQLQQHMTGHKRVSAALLNNVHRHHMNQLHTHVYVDATCARSTDAEVKLLATK